MRINSRDQAGSRLSRAWERREKKNEAPKKVILRRVLAPTAPTKLVIFPICLLCARSAISKREREKKKRRRRKANACASSLSRPRSDHVLRERRIFT